MTDTDKLLILQVRLHKLRSSKKNLDCPGVTRKIQRQIRNLEK